MSGTQLLRLLVNERLAAAAEEIFRLVETTIAEYQDEAARSKEQITQLTRQVEQLAVLKPEVTLFRADSQLASEDVLPSQQPDQLPNVEENETQDSQQVKEEQMDRCIGSDVEADTSNDAEVRHPKSEELLTAETVSVNVNMDDKLNVSSLSPQSQQEELFIISDQNNDSSEDVKVTLTESEPAGTDSLLFPTFSTITVTLNDDGWNGSVGLDSSSRDPSCSDSAFRKQRDQQQRKACQFCGKRFNRECFLIRHIDKIHTRLAYKCSDCDKHFTNRSHLNAHLRIHTGERPYKCSFCTKSFAQSSNLNVHLRMHTGEKPYFCTSCGKMVARSSHLKTCGMKNLKGKKYFGCLVCGKKFHTASNLQVHKKIHEAGKPLTVL